MAKLNLSAKRLQIDRANVTIVIATSIATFLTIFSLVASYSLLGQRSYQARVIEKKQAAKEQLDKNVEAVNTLINAYKQFVETPDNIIGGTATGSGDKDGDNAKIILDALPSKYDFPAVATSLEKLISDNGNTITSITGTDNEATQSAVASAVPVAIPFQISIAGNYESLQNILGVFERSIRPISISSLKISGKDDKLGLALVATTYYQPEKSLNIKSEVVK